MLIVFLTVCQAGMFVSLKHIILYSSGCPRKACIAIGIFGNYAKTLFVISCVLAISMSVYVLSDVRKFGSLSRASTPDS